MCVRARGLIVHRGETAQQAASELRSNQMIGANPTLTLALTQAAKQAADEVRLQQDKFRLAEQLRKQHEQARLEVERTQAAIKARK